MTYEEAVAVNELFMKSDDATSKAMIPKWLEARKVMAAKKPEKIGKATAKALLANQRPNRLGFVLFTLVLSSLFGGAPTSSITDEMWDNFG